MDSMQRGTNGEVLPNANIINSVLQFGQRLDQHPNFPLPEGFSENDLITFYSRANCIVAVFRDHQRGTIHAIAETTRDNPANGEWLLNYPVDTHTDVNAPPWLIEGTTFDWIASAPFAKAIYLVRCIQQDKFDLEDVAVLAFDFFRFDNRSLDEEHVPESVWVYYFIGEYLRLQHNLSLREVDDHSVHFLALPEIEAVPMWNELYEIGNSMTHWVKYQRGWKRPRRLGGYFSAAWWQSFSDTFDMLTNASLPPLPDIIVFPHEHPLVGRPGTGYDPDETPYGLPPLVDLLADEFLP